MPMTGPCSTLAFETMCKNFRLSPVGHQSVAGQEEQPSRVNET